jgi:Type IV secretion system pilin
MKKFIIIALLILVLAPVFAEAQTACSQNYVGSTLCNALPSIGGKPVTNIPSLITALFAWLATVIGTLALVMVMYSGAQMIFSRGEPAAVQKAKTSLTYSILGFLTVLFSYVLVSGIQFFVGFNDAIKPGQQTGGFFVNPINYIDLPTFVNRTVSNVLGLLGAVTMVYIIFAGFRYVTAAGNEEQTKKARQGLTWAILGLASVILSYFIVTVVINTVT